MHDESQLTQDRSTAHEGILVQSNAITLRSGEALAFKDGREELRTQIRMLISGKRKKHVNADRLLTESDEGKEHQAAVKSARKEAEQKLK